jgi:transcription-repair coupling factor (superfamily II helicase)
MWQHNCRSKNKKKITIIPNVENKIFQESVSWYISEKTVIFIQIRRTYFADKQFAKAEEAFENYLKILSTLRQSNYFKSS